MAYYGYTRVSTETQSESGYGLAVQEDSIKRYAAEHDITLAGIYTDAGISGNIGDDEEDSAINKRRELMALLTVVQPGDTVIVLNTSRLWRSDLTKAIIRRELIKRKVQVASIEQPRYSLYSKDPGEYLINAIMEALDVYERMSIAIKLGNGRAAKAYKGTKPAGVCPYGYRYSDDKKSIQIVEAEAAAVKRMFSEAQKGQSLHKIAEALTASGIYTRHGKAWSAGSIQAILRNPFYTGILTHAGRTIQGTHAPIISKIQYGKVSAALTRRHK